MITKISRIGLALLVAGALLALGNAPGRTSSTWDRLLQDVYSEHLARVMQDLPAHSGPPPLIDLSKGSKSREATDTAWEGKFKYYLGGREITDPGVPSPEEATSISLTITEYVGGGYALPARSSEVVVIANHPQPQVISPKAAPSSTLKSPWRFHKY